MPSDRDSEDDDTDRSRPTAAELRRHRRTVPRGVPVEVSDDVPPDLELDWPAEVQREDTEILRRAGRDPSDPALPAEVSALMRQLAIKMRAEFARGVARDVERLRNTVEGTPTSPGLAHTVSEHAKVIGPARTAASWALRGTVAAVLVVGGALYKRGAEEQRLADEVQSVRRDNERLSDEVTRLRNQLSKDRP